MIILPDYKCNLDLLACTHYGGHCPHSRRKAPQSYQPMLLPFYRSSLANLHFSTRDFPFHNIYSKMIVNHCWWTTWFDKNKMKRYFELNHFIKQSCAIPTSLWKRSQALVIVTLLLYNRRLLYRLYLMRPRTLSILFAVNATAATSPRRTANIKLKCCVKGILATWIHLYPHCDNSLHIYYY